MYAKFRKDSYEFYDDDIPELFSDSGHSHLFMYLNYDLSPIKTLLENFFAEQFDFAQMKLRDDRPSIEYNAEYEKAKQANQIIDLTEYMVPNAYIEGIIKVLTDSHPYYSFGQNAENEVESIIVDGFNLLLSSSEYVMDKGEYGKHLNELLTIHPFPPIGFRSSFNGENNINVEYHYKTYLETNNRQRSMYRLKKMGVSLTPPSLSIFEAQQQLKRFLSEVLCTNYSIGVNQKKRIDYTFQIDLSVHVIDGVVYEIYSVGSLKQLLECEVVHMATAGIKLRICKNCNYFFISDDSRRNYCDRIMIDGKTCADIGPNRNFRSQKKNDRRYNAYRKAFSKNSMRFNRGAITAEQLHFWREQAEYKRKAESSDYYSWLDLSIKEIRESCTSND